MNTLAKQAEEHGDRSEQLALEMRQRLLSGAPPDRSHPSAGPSMQRLVNLLVDEVKRGGAVGDDCADRLTCLLAMKVEMEGPGQQIPARGDEPMLHHRLQRVIQFMEANLDKNLSLATLAAKSSYSRSHFLRIFRSATGYSPHRFLVYMRIEKAKRMMMSTRSTLLEIAIACGFSSHAHFTRAFQKTMKISPSHYRRHA